MKQALDPEPRQSSRFELESKPRRRAGLRKFLAILTTGLILALAGHEAVHATLTAMDHDAAPCVFCHAGRNLTTPPAPVIQHVAHARIERLCVMRTPRLRPRRTLAFPLFHRPPPAFA